MRTPNHRGWMVLESISNADGNRCVDLFEGPTSLFGFEQFRADAEDQGRWTALGGVTGGTFATPVEAARAAGASVGWLSTEPAASESLARWIESQTRPDQSSESI